MHIETILFTKGEIERENDKVATYSAGGSRTIHYLRAAAGLAPSYREDGT